MRTVINEGLAEFARFCIEPRVEAIMEASASDTAPGDLIKSRLASLMAWAEEIEKGSSETMAAELN